MKILWFTLTEWIALITFLGGVIFALMKFYSVLMSILNQLEVITKGLSDSQQDRTSLHEADKALHIRINKQDRRILTIETLLKIKGDITDEKN